MKRILGASVGSCVHVAGIISFLNIAAKLGYNTKYAGSAVSVENLDKAINEFMPDIVGISYRLTPESSAELFNTINKKIISSGSKISFILGTTSSVADFLEKKGLLGMFDKIFTGGEPEDQIIQYLEGKKTGDRHSGKPPQNLLDRILYKKPYPLLRHHYGRPTLKETVEGIKVLSDSGFLDVISLGPDQNTQEFFFHPEKMNRQQDGAGGVPIRSEDDLGQLYTASRTGNYPLMRCYSGTNDVLKFAEILVKNINNAWCAIPLLWYNEIDNRSSRKLEVAIKENQEVMRWHGWRGIPLEVNESHHWSLRYSSDSIAVAAAYIAAYNAKKMGVKNYVAQYMFNTPAQISFTMDLAKMLAKVEMIESLHDDSFTSFRETRSGLYSMPADFNKGKGQLASSTMLQMQLNPSIVHVVAYCESSYAAKPEDIIQSCSIVQKVIQNCVYGAPDMQCDLHVNARKKNLIHDAELIIKKIKSLDFEKKYGDPLTEPAILAEAVRKGILDAPHLAGVKAACGKLQTMFFDGACLAIDDCGNMVSEEERLENIL